MSNNAALFRPWEDTDIQDILENLSLGVPISEVALEFQRTERAIIKKLKIPAFAVKEEQMMIGWARGELSILEADIKAFKA